MTFALSQLQELGEFVPELDARGQAEQALEEAKRIARDAHRALIPDIEIRDLRSIDTLSGFNWAITNLPYRDQDVLAAHLVELGARDGCNVALLTRAEWIVAGARRQLVHHHPNFAGVVHLTLRPRWTETLLASPRHNFIWAVWSAEPRPPGVDAWARFADRRSP
jgi:hypothetical protein